MKIKSIIKYKYLKKLPEGRYKGTWSGYVVDIPLYNYKINVNQGIRGKVDVEVVVDSRGDVEVIR